MVEYQRGKTYTARKIACSSWRGIKTQVFNVGNYRRNLSGCWKCPHLFFDPKNGTGMEARRQAAQAGLDDMLEWFASEGEVGIYDATTYKKATGLGQICFKRQRH